MSADYDPRSYWSQRLEQNFNLRGTGHLYYDERYNAWLYRAKARALRQALAGARPGDPALDLGSGIGWVIDQLLEHGLAVEGCDISAVAVARLERRSRPRASSRWLSVRIGSSGRTPATPWSPRSTSSTTWSSTRVGSTDSRRSPGSCAPAAG